VPFRERKHVNSPSCGADIETHFTSTTKLYFRNWFVFKGTIDIKTSSFDAPRLILAFQREKPVAIGVKAPFPGFIEPALASSNLSLHHYVTCVLGQRTNWPCEKLCRTPVKLQALLHH
jgi:hypothetical protein